jgi:hypothetical protein
MILLFFSSGTFTPTTLGIGAVSPAGLELTGGDTSDVSVNWSPVANHTYQIIRNDLASPALVVSETSTAPATLFYSQSVSPVGSPNSGLVDLPLQGIVGNYTIQVRLSTANGGDNVWYDATGTNNPFDILRIKEPTLDDTQDFNTSSPTPISHSISLKLNGLGGTLQYGWNTTGSPQQSAVTNWQSSATFANAFTRGSTYYFYARRSTDAADFDLSTAQVVPPLATYGLRVYSSNGSKIVFDTTSQPMNLITCKVSGTEVTQQTLSAGATSANITVDGLTPTNGSSIFIVVRAPYSLNTTPPYTLNRQTGYFTLTNNLTSSATFYFFAGRYR